MTIRSSSAWACKYRWLVKRLYNLRNSLALLLDRHKSNLQSLKDMLPEDMLAYCQEHRLLDVMLDPVAAEAAATGAMAAPAASTADYASIEPSA